MMIAGTLSGNGEWIEAESMARSIERELVADELIDLDDETPEAALDRRKGLIALARGIVKHIQAEAVAEIPVAAGELRQTGESSVDGLSIRVPAGSKTLDGTVS